MESAKVKKKISQLSIYIQTPNINSNKMNTKLGKCLVNRTEKMKNKLRNKIKDKENCDNPRRGKHNLIVILTNYRNEFRSDQTEKNHDLVFD